MEASQSKPDWRLYERFVAGLISDENASDDLTVIPKAKLTGCISGIKREVDVLIDARLAADVTRRVIVDAKYRKRKVDIKVVEEFEGMMRDCRADRGIIVCSSGFSEAALRRAQESIVIRLIPLEELSYINVSDWEPCIGLCAERERRKSQGLVLYDQPFGLAIGYSPLYVLVTGKCDACGNFHIWCWSCGSKFSLADEDEHHCGCEWFWITAVEEDGIDNFGNRIAEVLLLLVIPSRNQVIRVDRRPWQ
jgi:hypothetical protein